MISSYFDLRARRMDRLDNEANAERRHREILEERREERRLEEERRRDDERRHQELIALIVASMNNGRNQSESQNELVRTLQQAVAELQTENARLRQQNGNSDTTA